MGLDMYLKGERYFNAYCAHPLNVEAVSGHKSEELGYWRKHPDLHGFIVHQFRSGNDKSDFRVNLTEDRLRQLIAAVRANALPKTTGFYFGESTTANDPNTIEKLERAIAWLKVKEEGVSRFVIYVCSW